jgi:hypothetical protein
VESFFVGYLVAHTKFQNPSGKIEEENTVNSAHFVLPAAPKESVCTLLGPISEFISNHYQYYFMRQIPISQIGRLDYQSKVGLSAVQFFLSNIVKIHFKVLFHIYIFIC